MRPGPAPRSLPAGSGLRTTVRSTSSTATRSARGWTGSTRGRNRSSSGRAAGIWGDRCCARAVDAFFDEHEARYPVVDNFADEGAGLAHGLGAEGTTDLDAAGPALLRYVLFRMPWQQFRVDLDAGDVQPPALGPRRGARAGSGVPGGFIAERRPVQAAGATGAGEAGRLAALMDELGDDELIALCDYRAAARRARRRFERPLTQFDPQGPPVRECPRLPDSRGGLFDYFWRTRDLDLRRSSGGRAGRRPGPPQRPIGVFVHNHTHLVDWRQSVLESDPAGPHRHRRRLLAGPQRPLAGRHQRRPVAADHHAGAVRPPAGRARPLGRRAAAGATTRAPRSLLRFRADRSV